VALRRFFSEKCGIKRVRLFLVLLSLCLFNRMAPKSLDTRDLLTEGCQLNCATPSIKPSAQIQFFTLIFTICISHFPLIVKAI